jgi:GntR family transcriptional regulator of arabinose operon
MITAKSKSDQVREIILTRLHKGQYKLGDRIESDNVFSRELGISKNTVREAISTLVNDGYIKRIQGKGSFVSEPAPSPQTTKIITAVCCSEKWHDPSQDVSWFNTQFLLEGFSSAMGNCYLLNILYMHPDNQSLDEGIKIMLDSKSDGFIFSSLGGYGPYIDKLTEIGKPCVVRTLKPYFNSHCVYGLMDDAFYDAMSYLIENGRKKIAFLINDNHFSRNKLSGVLRAMKKHDIDSSSLLQIDVDNGFELDGYRAITELLGKQKDVDAIISVTDRLAFGAFAAIKDFGLRIPEDIAIIGSDDLPECQKMEPAMASISSDFHRMGELMFAIMDKALTKPGMKLTCKPVEHTFIPRKSCKFDN